MNSGLEFKNKVVDLSTICSDWYDSWVDTDDIKMKENHSEISMEINFTNLELQENLKRSCFGFFYSFTSPIFHDELRIENVKSISRSFSEDEKTLFLNDIELQKNEVVFSFTQGDLRVILDSENSKSIISRIRTKDKRDVRGNRFFQILG